MVGAWGWQRCQLHMPIFWKSLVPQTPGALRMYPGLNRESFPVYCCVYLWKCYYHAFWCVKFASFATLPCLYVQTTFPTKFLLMFVVFWRSNITCLVLVFCQLSPQNIDKYMNIFYVFCGLCQLTFQDYMSPRALLDVFDKRRISWPHRESNPRPSRL